MNQMSHNNYYYGKEAEQFTFYRIPKALFSEEKYQDLSSDAKILYSLMLDRMSLSLRNQWLDEQQRVYVYFSQKEAQEVLGCGHNKTNALFADLAKVGLIQRKRQGLGRPGMIYVMKFSTNDKQEGTQIFLNEEAYCPEKKQQEVPKEEGNNTEKNKTDFSENNLSLNRWIRSIDSASCCVKILNTKSSESRQEWMQAWWMKLCACWRIPFDPASGSLESGRESI